MSFFAPNNFSFAREDVYASSAYPKGLENNLSEYGYFQPGESDFGLINILTALVEKLRRPGDPDFSVILSKDPRINAFNYQAEANNAYIVVNIGLIQAVQSLDELAILVAHELRHSSAFGRSARALRGQLEEIETADRGSMESALQAGYDPRAILSLFANLTPGAPARSNVFAGVLGTHPNMESRLTAANVWLKENFSKRRFPDKRPVPWDKYSVNKFKANPIPQMEQEYGRKKEALHELDRLSRSAGQSQAFQNLTPYYRLVLFYGSLASYKFDYYDLLRRTIDNNEPLDQESLAILTNGTLFTEAEIRTKFDWEADPFSSRIATFLIRLIREIPPNSLSSEQNKLIEYLYGNRLNMMSAGIGVTSARIPMMDENGAGISDYMFGLEIEKAILSVIASPSLHDLKTVKDVKEFTRNRRGYGIFGLSQVLKFIEDLDDPEVLADSFIYAEYDMRYYEVSEVLERNDEKLTKAFKWAIEHDQYNGDALRSLLRCSNRLPSKLIEDLVNAFSGQNISPARKILLYVQLDRFYDHSNSKTELFSGLKKSFKSPAELFSPTITTLKVHTAIKQIIENSETSWQLDWDLAVQIVQDPNAWLLAREANEIDVLYRQFASRYSGPAYDYNQKYAEALQKWMEVAMIRSRELPQAITEDRGSLQKWIRFWKLLTSRAVTSYTDRLALKIFNLANIKKNPELVQDMQEALEKKRIWDFALRKEILLISRKSVWEKFKLIEDKYDRNRMITEEIDYVNRTFPESTFERQIALEVFSNQIRANMSEAILVEKAKSDRDSSADGVGIRVFSGFYEHVFSQTTNRYENTFATLQFLLGIGPVPESLAKALSTVGPERFQRMFSTLDPEIRALVIAPLLERPRGLLTEKVWEDKLLDLILSGVTAHQTESRLFLKALIYSLEKEASFEKPLVIAFMLAMKLNSSGKDVPIGVIVRQCLEAMGNSGVSLGQKIRQRELAPQEILIHLDDLQDRTRVPSRFTIFEMIKRRIPNAERMLMRGDLVVLDIVGAASSKVVITVQYKNGVVEKFEEEVLKMLRDNFDRTTEVEIAKLRSMLYYLETHGSERYRRFRSVIDLIERNLRNQNDLRAESKLFEETKQLYEKASQGSQFKFVVATPHPARGVGRDYSHEELARGSSLKSLSENQQKQVYSEIYEVEAKILLSDLKDSDVVVFEADRHRGNYIVNLESKTIFVIDYNLLSRITNQERLAVIETLGFLYMHLAYKTSLAGVLPWWVPGFVRSRIGEGVRSWINAKEESLSRIKILFDGITTERWANFLKKAQPILDRRESIDQAGIFSAFQELVAVAEEAGLQLRPQVNDYIFALGHLDFYSKFVKGSQNPLSLKIRNHMAEKIKSILFPGNNTTSGQKIQTATKLLMKSTKIRNSCESFLMKP